MSLDSIDHLDFEADPGFGATQTYVDEHSVMPSGRVIDTITVHCERPNGRFVIGVAQNVEFEPGLRTVVASADLSNVKVIDLIRTPGRGGHGIASYAELVRSNNALVRVHYEEIPYGPADQIIEPVPPGGVAKAYVIGADREFEPDLMAESRIAGRQKGEYRLAQEVEAVLGPVTAR